MLGCRAVDRGQPLTVAHLFAGFSERAGPLFILGLLYTAIAIAIALTVAGILLMFFGAAVFAQLLRHERSIRRERSHRWGAPGRHGRRPAIRAAVPASRHGRLVRARAGRALRGLEPWEAMKLSFAGCLRERPAVSDLRSDRHRSRGGGVHTVGPGLARGRAVDDRVGLHRILRHLRRYRRQLSGTGLPTISRSFDFRTGGASSRRNQRRWVVSPAAEKPCGRSR